MNKRQIISFLVKVILMNFIFVAAIVLSAKISIMNLDKSFREKDIKSKIVEAARKKILVEDLFK